MLDVHAPLAGDVSDQLDQFAFDVYLQHTLEFLDNGADAELSPLEVEVLERGLASFPCERPPAPYQEEGARPVSPLAGWAALTLLHRLWPLAVVLGLGVAGLAVWRLRAHAGRR